MADLLPGLPDELALLCLARMPRIFHTALGSVNKKWRETVGSKEFYSVRKQLGVTDESVFLIKKFDKPPSQLHCMEIDLKTKKSCKTLFVNNEVTRDIFNGGYGCTSVGHLVLFFGGESLSEDETPSGTLYVFNTLSRTWTKGADMQRPRSWFCYGVIDGKLYVAGGYAHGVVRDAEVYDADTNSWSCIARMPLALQLDVFFVWRNKLVVRGITTPRDKPYVFSYSPVKNEWKKQKWLVDVLSPFKPLISSASGVTTKSDDVIHVGLAEMEVNVSGVTVMKLDNKTLEWKSVCKYRDEADQYKGEPPKVFPPQLFIFGLKDRVLVMHHLDYEDVQLVFSRDMVKLYMKCPSVWVSTIVDA